MDNRPVRVVIVDDHPIVRAGMRTILGDAPDLQIVADGARGEDALRLVSTHQPDVLILDVNLPDRNGLDVIRQLRAQGSACAILILTVQDDTRTVFGLLEAGASGYVLKDDALETLATAVQAVARGERWLSSKITNQVVQRALKGNSSLNHAAPPSGLTPREMEVLQLLALGLSNEAIAQKLFLTLRTVQNHVSAVYSKLEVGSRSEAVLYAIRRGWVTIPRDQDARNAE